MVDHPILVLIGLAVIIMCISYISYVLARIRIESLKKRLLNHKHYHAIDLARVAERVNRLERELRKND